MNGTALLKNAAVAAAAGVAGTVAMQGLRKANEKWLPSISPRMRKDPGMYMVKKVEDALPDEVREQVSKAAEKVAAGSLALGYGATAATLYTAVRSEPSALLDGAALGIGLWAIGALGWLPALKIAARINKQKPARVVDNILHHVAFGVLTVSAYKKLRQVTA